MFTGQMRLIHYTGKLFIGIHILISSIGLQLNNIGDFFNHATGLKKVLPE